MAGIKATTGNPRRIDLTGRKFGRWQVVRYVGYVNRMSLWHCRCECGNEAEVPRGNLLGGKSASCGCLRKDVISKRRTSHGRSKWFGDDPTYSTWVEMKRRCFNPNFVQWKHYGGRGITCCPRWDKGENGKSGFECFAADMGDRPSDRHSLDRIDPEGSYEPGNCRWATRSEQAKNKRNNRVVEFRGKQMILQDAIKASGIPSWTVYERLGRGWTEERALTQPVQARKWRGPKTRAEDVKED